MVLRSEMLMVFTSQTTGVFLIKVGSSAGGRILLDWF